MKRFSLTLCLSLTSATWVFADHHGGGDLAKKLDELLAGIAQPDEAQRYDPRMAVRDLTSAASTPGSKTRDQYVSLLLDRLQVEETPQAAKAWIIRQLENVGGAESVPALAGLMGSPFHHLRELSRRALEQNPSEEAGAALRELLEKEQDRNQRRALVHSLGQRRDAAAVSILAKLLESKDKGLQRTAVSSLGKIASDEAVALLTAAHQSMPKSERLASALLEAAQVLTPHHADRALPILKGLYRYDLPGRIQAAALRGLLAASPDDVDDRLLLALQSKEALVRQAAINGCRGLKSGSVMPNVLAVKLPELSHREQGMALAVLADSKDPTVASQLADTLSGGKVSEDLKLSLIGALGQLGGVDVAGRVLELAARSGDEELRDAARESLAKMPGEAVSAWLLTATRAGDIDSRSEAIRSLGGRGYRKAVPVLFAHVEAGPKVIRQTSLETLGTLARSEDIARLVTYLDDADDRALKAVMQACRSARLRSQTDGAVDAVLAAVEHQDEAGKAKLLPCLGILGGEKALGAVEGFLKEKSLRSAAMKTLTGWSGPEAGPTFIKIAKAESISDVNLTLTLRGLVRLLENDRNGIDGRERMKLAMGGMHLARSVDDKRLFLPVLGRLRSPEALEALMNLLKEKDLAEEAALAALSAVEKMRRRRGGRLKQQVLKAIVRADVDEETSDRARELLDRL